MTKIFDEQYIIVDTPDSYKLANHGPSKEELSANCTEHHEPGSIGFMMEGSVTEFYITLSGCEWLDGVLPCFGRIWKRNTNKILDILKSSLTLPGGKPKTEIKVLQCGQY